MTQCYGFLVCQERLHKLKLPPAVDFTRKLNGSVCNKRFSEDILNATSVRGKKPSLRGLSMQKKLKVVQTSKLIVKPQMPVLPVRSILKNHKNALFGLNSAICSLQCSSQKNHSRIQRSDRHVRFSDKDVILGPAQKHTSDAFEHSNGKLFSDAFAASSEKYPATEHDKEVAPMEVDRTDGGVFISTNNGSDVRVIAGRENLLNTHSNGDPQRSLRQHVTFLDKIKHFPENSVCLRQAVIHDDNEHMFDQGHLTMSHKPAYTGIPSLISATEGRCNPCVNAQVGGDVMRAFNQSGKLAFLDTNRGVPATCSMAFIGASSPPSTSCAASDENANRRLPFLSQSATETFNGRILQYQPLCHASPKVLMNSMRSLPEWKQRAVLREKYPDDGFLGLPLNSQGELIQFSSSGKGAFDQLMLPSAMTCSSSTLAVHNLTTPQRTREYVSVEKSHTGEGELSRDLLNLFPVQNYVMGNPKVHLPAIFGVTELEGTERSDLHWLNSVRGTNHLVRPLDSHLHWSFNGCGQYDQVQNQNVYGINHPQENSCQIGLNSTPPTMRLMGKDVAVGRSSKEMQGFGDGRLWTAKEMITRDCPTSTGLENSSMERNLLQDWLLHPASGQSNILGQSSASQSNHASRSNLPMEVSKAMFPNPFFNWQTNVVHRDGSLTINENPTNKVHSFLHSPASSMMFNGAHSFQESFITEAETLSSSSQLPLQSNHRFSCQHMPCSPVECNQKQNVPHATQSAYNFPFLQPDYKEHVQPSGLQRFSRSLPPWLLHPHRDKPLITSSHSFSEVGGKYLPQFISGTNLFPTQHVNHLQEVSYPMNSQSHIKRSFGPASILHPALVPVIPGVNPTSAINMNCRNKVKLKDAVKSKAFQIKDCNPCKRTKRPAAKADCSTKPTWIPNLEMQKHLSAMTELTRENIGRDIPCNAGMVDSNLSKDKARRLGCCSNESPKDGLRTSTGSDFSAEYNSAISGPVKLCAGAKHILKPSQAMDQDNARPIHSSLPFAIAANCDNILDSRKRLTKIYRF